MNGTVGYAMFQVIWWERYLLRRIPSLPFLTLFELCSTPGWGSQPCV